MGIAEIFDSRAFNAIILVIIIVLIIVVAINVVYYHHLRSKGEPAIGSTTALILMIANIILGIFLLMVAMYFLWRTVYHPAERARQAVVAAAKVNAVGTSIVTVGNRVARVFDHDTIKIQRDGKVVSLHRLDDGTYNSAKDGSGAAYECDASRCEEKVN